MMDKKSVSCVQINLHKSIAASAVLNKRDEKICFITEPNSYGGKVKNLVKPNTQVLASDGSNPLRAAIRVDRDLHPWMVPEWSDGDLCVVGVKIESKLCYIGSLYLDILKDVRHRSFLRLVDECNHHRIPLVVGMDSNAHSPLWGCSDRNARGEELEDVLISKNLTVLNNGTVPTFSNKHGKSIIDVTIANAYALQNLNLSGWVVSNEDSLSDHRYIKFELGEYAPHEEKVRNLKKANWTQFAEALDRNSLPEIVEDGSNLNECADALQTLIQKALDKSCPMKNAVKRPPNPWWNEELEQIRQELRGMANVCNNSPERYTAYRNLKSIFVRKIRKAKKKSWQDFCTKAESTKEISKIVKILKPKPQLGISLFKNQGRILSPKETLDNLMDTHFLESVRIDEERNVEAVDHEYKDEGTKKFLSYINPNKVKRAFRTFGPMKAAGPDGFKPIVLQNLTDEIYCYIDKIFRLAVYKGYAPKSWRMMKVIFLPKAGKEDYGLAKSYRPITLSNFILKGLERLVQWFINDSVITDPMHAQHAYTVGRSCDTAVSEAVDFIEKNTFRGSHVLAVSLDCSGAFDRIKFESADNAMRRKGFPSSIRNLYLNILKHRTVKAELQGEETIRRPMRGSPQGGVLSPLIWNVIMDTILTQFKGTAVRVVGYADDILLMIAGKDPGTLVDGMNKALKTVLRWGDENGLVFNPSKTCMVRFSQCKKFSQWRDVRMNAVTLSYEDSMKYLGVTLQKSLSWNMHVHERSKKSTKIINLANACIGQKWGLNPERALWIYSAMARPMVTYGAVVWSPRITNTTRLKLTRLQRKAMLNMTSSMRSTPSDGMEVVLGLLPLDLHAHQLGTCSHWRNRSGLRYSWDGLGRTKNMIGHRRHHDNIIDNYCHKTLPVDLITRKRFWLDDDDLVEEPDIVLYTDGSKMECGTGCGWAVCEGDTIVAEESTYLGNDTSVFQSEVIAISRGVQWILDNCENQNVVVYSDSQAALKAIRNVDTTSKVVWSCKEVLREAKENHRIALRWIKGHADHTGNELADYLARQGSEMRCHTTYPEVPVPATLILNQIKDHFLAEWQKRWSNANGMRQSKIFFPKVEGTKIKKLCKWSKTNLNLLLQVGTGHALVAHHISKWTEVEDVCYLCEEEQEDIVHLYDRCPVLELVRREHAALAASKEMKLIKFFQIPKLRALFEYRALSCDDSF